MDFKFDENFKKDFDMHIEKAKELPESVPKRDKDVLYGLKMHTIHGRVNTVRPGMYNMKDPHEWDAWHAVRGKSREDTANEFKEKVKDLHSKYVVDA